MTIRPLSCALVFLTVAAVTTRSAAADITKEACLDAHSRAQDERAAGHLSTARKLFLQCAQAACPGVVQSDCAEAVDDLTKIQPTITLAARDADGNDLPDTTVYIDDILIVTRLDDGKPHDIDPGKHVVKFSNGDRDQIVTVVIGSGEKGRSIVGNFPRLGGGSPGTTKPDTGATPVPPPPARSKTTSHPGGAKVTMIVGAVLLAGGAGVAAWGMSQIPSNCSLSSHECLAPPGDPVFDDASSAVGKFNIGLIVGGVGAVAVVGGLVWYLKGARTEETERPVAMPWFTADGAGVAFTTGF